MTDLKIEEVNEGEARDKLKEELKDVGTKLTEAGKEIANVFEGIGERIEKHDIPKLTRDITIISAGAITIYLMGTAISYMVPTAIPIFAQLGYTIGLMIPFVINFMIIMTMLAVAKTLIG